MKEIIKQILEKWACKHQWSEKDTYTQVADDGTKTGYVNIYHCIICGKFKEVKIG